MSGATGGGVDSKPAKERRGHGEQEVCLAGVAGGLAVLRAAAPRGNAVARSIHGDRAASACVPRDAACVCVRSARTDQRVGAQHRAEARCAVPSAAPVLRRRSGQRGDCAQAESVRTADDPVAPRSCVRAERTPTQAASRGTYADAARSPRMERHTALPRGAGPRRVERSRGTHADASNGRTKRTPTQHGRRERNAPPRCHAVLPTQRYPMPGSRSCACAARASLARFFSRAMRRARAPAGSAPCARSACGSAETGSSSSRS